MITKSRIGELPVAISSQQEWLETNGLGGFASSSIIGMNTRRYHGLLTAALRPPTHRFVLLSKLEETLIIGETRYELCCNQYPGAIHPRGYSYLHEFRLDPVPRFLYRVDNLEFEKRICMVYGENTLVTEYRVRPIGENQRFPECCLEVRPLLAFRDYHSLTRQNTAIDPSVRELPSRATVMPYKDLPALHFAHCANLLQRTGDWYYNFEYEQERQRGLDYREDLFNPFVLAFDLQAAGSCWLISTTGEHSILEAQYLQRKELDRRKSTRLGAPLEDPFVQDLTAAADQFLCQRNDLRTVIAGYHWFTDWGRDTMVALRGLTLVTSRFEAARSILQAFADLVSEGMLPNRFPDTGEMPEYNTVDATLWFFEAVYSYLLYTRDFQFVRNKLFGKLKEILAWHFKGTRYGIRVNDRGLLQCGTPQTQLTWMDAKVGDHVVTPRNGMPVEVQALYYNALRVMEQLCGAFEEPETSRHYGAAACLAKDSFQALFWNEKTGCLYDVVDGDRRDESIRPNQVFAMSLSFPILTGERADQALAVVERELLTSRGLRTLSRDHPSYRPRYEGDVWSRDTAYHQGTVWPWLLGPFINAYLAVHNRSDAAREKARGWICGFKSHLKEAGLGQISEIFDGDPPHAPRGCIAQAWSVAELLRAEVEEILEKAPRVSAFAPHPDSLCSEELDEDL